MSRLLVKAQTLHEGETRDSRASHDLDAWEPEWIDGRFVAMLSCPSCDAEIGLAGTYRVVDERGYDQIHREVGDYEKYYSAQWFTEAPALIECPPDTPMELVEEVKASFQLFWGDELACANRIRSAVELLLTLQRVPKTGGRVPGMRRKFLTLHQRIEKYRSIRSDVADQLMAIKWLGNAGSHSNKLTSDDLLDGYELLAFVLDELYLNRRARIRSLTHAINRRKVPRSRRRGSGA